MLTLALITLSQWVPGQFGLNAGAIPDPGITYANMALNYSASN